MNMVNISGKHFLFSIVIFSMSTGVVTFLWDLASFQTLAEGPNTIQTIRQKARNIIPMPAARL